MEVSLRPWSRTESDALVAGRGGPPVELAWAADYPAEDTFIALGLLRLAYAAAAVEVEECPDWWLHQIIVGADHRDVVVGDIGFHGPPEPGRPTAVEIGYHVVPDWRRRGVATAACAQILTTAWRNGAELVRAEAVGPASVSVLRHNGFGPVRGERSWFEIGRPCPA